jgi:succinoglycan biosynthesis protein ExoO
MLPVFNTEKFIGQAIQSVLNQTFDDYELIVIDDGSTDHTVEVIQQFKDSRIYLIEHKTNMGVCTARNTGIREAKGEWIAPLDADDAWHKERLTRLLKVAEKYPHAFIGSDVMICLTGRKNELIPWKTFFNERRLEVHDFFFPRPAEFVKYGLSVLPIFPKEPVENLNIRFREEFSGHDWLYYLLRLYSAGLKYIIINEPLYYYRIRQRSHSTSYSCICTQIAASDYLQSVDWVDKETRQIIKKSAKITRYRLLTTAMREKRWGKVMRHAIQSPMSICYVLQRILPWAFHQQEFSKFSKKIDLAFKA